MALVVAALAARAALAQPETPPPLAPLDVGDPHAVRLLVVSPHPDDGALGGAGLMTRVVAAGGRVRVVQMTSGDAFSTSVKTEANTATPSADDYRRYAAQREHESVTALSALHVRRRALTFLGFPDDGLCRLEPDY